MVKHTLNIFKCSHRKIFKICFGHFSKLSMKGLKEHWKEFSG